MLVLIGSAGLFDYSDHPFDKRNLLFMEIQMMLYFVCRHGWVF